jgi:hypothetical protein
MENNFQVVSYFEQQKHDGYQSVYSPAHIEEIAFSTMKNNYPLQKTVEKLKFFSNMNNDYELLPFKRNDVKIIKEMGVYLCIEAPKDCYSRVVKNYPINDHAILLNKKVLEESTNLNIFNKNSNEFNNTKHEDVLSGFEENIMCDFRTVLSRRYKKSHTRKGQIKFSDISHDFQLVECIIEILFNWIECLRFFPENIKDVSKPRSRMNDVSHAIYASYTSKIISGDKNFVNKLLVVYKFLSIDTNITYMKYNKNIKEFEFISLM